MTDDLTGVRQATSADVEAVTAVLAEAFLEDPVSGWIFPDGASRAALHRPFFRVFVELVLADGHIDTVGDVEGVALWLPADPDHPEPEADLGAVFAEAIGPDAAARFAVLDALMTENHPPNVHAYLPFIAVSPDSQRRGIGSTLLRHAFTKLDRDGVAAYLESSSPRNQALYERLGFKPLDTQLALPGGPSLQPMWRSPGNHPGTP